MRTTILRTVTAWSQSEGGGRGGRAMLEGKAMLEGRGREDH